MHEQKLQPVFQPIANLRDGAIYGHEALIRGPQGTAMQSPDALLRAAREEGLLHEFELHCIVVALNTWCTLNPVGRLFVNISGDALVHLVEARGVKSVFDYVRQLGLAPRKLVIEITEHDRVSDMNALAAVVTQVQDLGVSIALDDFSDGHSSLRMWAQLKPEIVKIDKYFASNISQHADNLKTLQALTSIAEVFGTSLVAEGIETPDDLRVLRDLGIRHGQGYLLGRPAPQPRVQIDEAAVEVLRDQRVAVFPERQRATHTARLRGISVIEAPCAGLQTTNDELAQMFFRHPELHAIAVVDEELPMAIVNRQKFLTHYATPYYREVHGRKRCIMHANHSPRLIELDDDVEQLVGILTSQDQRYLSDGFIVSENGRYRGLGTGDQLVRSVTEVRIEAARHANPLTFLPGNIPISQHIARLLESCAGFAACYGDLNNFKPFNDYYGYWKGDEMIRLVARITLAHCDTLRDFVGHVGGDDFIVLFQSADWEERCRRISDEFALAARELFDPAAREAGGIEAEDRYGVNRFFPFTTLSFGALRVRGGEFRNAEDVASQAALAKHDAKVAGTALFVRESTAAPVRPGA
jgi:EAL domain-containing protein (putative c-di-GMP-specific phosphodiesterase class I)/GGDEF domain-containing protein